MASIDHTDGRARRNVFVLVLAQAILGAQMPMIFTIGGLAGQSLASNVCFATLPISLIVLGSMFAAPNVSALMGRFGRRAGFFAGAAGGALGSSLCALALFLDSFLLFLAGALFVVQPDLDFRTGLFEIVSAFGTVGWSAGATSNLNPAAQVVVAVTMFAGRFGPLTIALFMAGRERQDPVRFATERIRIG